MIANGLLSKVASLMPSKLSRKGAVNSPQAEVGGFLGDALRAHDNWYHSHSKTEQRLLPSFIGAMSIIETAALEGDLDSVLAYARLPELCDLTLKGLLPLLREIHQTPSVYSLVRQEHIDYYRRVSNVRFLHDTHKGIPARDSDMEELERFVLADMENAEAILALAEERGITSVETIKEIMAEASVAPAIGNGVL